MVSVYEIIENIFCLSAYCLAYLRKLSLNYSYGSIDYIIMSIVFLTRLLTWTSYNIAKGYPIKQQTLFHLECTTVRGHIGNFVRGMGEHAESLY